MNQGVAYARQQTDDPVNREKNDFYPTWPGATEALLRVESFDGPIWEPACGEGDMSSVLERAGYAVESTDLIERGYGESRVDFLMEHLPRAPNIVTNPPFGLAKEFVDKALYLTTGKVAMFLRHGCPRHEPAQHIGRLVHRHTGQSRLLRRPADRRNSIRQNLRSRRADWQRAAPAADAGGVRMMCPQCRTEWDHTVYIVAGIQAMVADYYGIDTADMLSARRGRDVAHPRQLAMLLAREFTPKSLPDIGRRFNRDHTTVIYGIRAAEARMVEDGEERSDYATLRGMLAA